MMDNLPAPLVPVECDLRDFAFMPLDVRRLRDSDLRYKESAAACWAAVLLWSAAWHQLPAASLPDDDCVLAGHAGLTGEAWRQVRDGALRGWIKCADGRLYHPVVAEKARESWRSKLERMWRTEVARVKKANQRHGTKEAEPTFEEWLARREKPVEHSAHTVSQNVPNPSPPCPQGRPWDMIAVSLEAREDDHAHVLAAEITKGQGKGQGEGQGQGQLDSLSSLRSDDDAALDATNDDTPTDDEPKKAAKAPATGTRLPEDWTPGPDGAEFARKLGISPREEFERFRDYWLAKPGKDGRKVDWQATWRNWCRNAGDRVRPGFAATSSPSGSRATVMSGSW